MALKIERFDSGQEDLYRLALEIRFRVFVDEQGVDAALEKDAHEDRATYYLVFDQQEALATGRWRETDKGIKLERFAVLPAHRNRGLGAVVLQAILEEILPLQKKIYLHAQERAVRFYERHGFIVEGQAFEEAGIRHFAMIYKVS